MNGWKLLYVVWEGLGSFLRVLSLSGTAGNAAAFFLYVCISLLPALALWIILQKGKRRMRGADTLLLVLSAYTFYLLYAFINPGLLAGRLPDGLGGAQFLPLIKAIYGSLWLSLPAAWLLLTLNRFLNSSEILDRKEFLCRGLHVLLTAAMCLWGLAALYTQGAKAAAGIAALRANAAGAAADYAFLFLRAAVNLVPVGFSIAILNRVRVLAAVMQNTPFEAEEVEAAKKLASISTAAVSVSVFCGLFWNGALFLFAGELVNTDYQWEISLFPLLTAFASLILARYLKAAGELKQDNEMII